MTKTQARRLNQSILSKSTKLFVAPAGRGFRMSTSDFSKIEAIVKKNLRKLK
jgi:hypothetical protein